MIDYIPDPEQLEKKIDGWVRLLKKRPWPFTLLFIFLACIPFFLVYNYFIGNTALKQKVADLERANLLLETQVAPFRALALDKYTLPEAQALAKLAADYTLIQEQLEQYVSKIRDFEVEVTVNFVANWVTEKSNLSFMESGEILSMTLMLKNGQERIVKFVPSELSHLRTSPDSVNTRIFTFRAEVKKGDPIFSVNLQEIISSEKVEVAILGIEQKDSSNQKLTVSSFEAIFYVNGEKTHHITILDPVELSLPEKTGSGYALMYKKSNKFGMDNNAP